MTRAWRTVQGAQRIKAGGWSARAFRALAFWWLLQHARDLTRTGWQEEIEVLRKRVGSAEELGEVMQGGFSQGERTLMLQQIHKLELEIERSAEQKSELEDVLDSTSAQLTHMAERVRASQREALAAQSRLQQVQGQLQQLQGDTSGAWSREEDLSLIRQLQHQVEQAESEKEQTGASLASMQDRVETAELARNRLHELVMQLESDARRLTAEKLKLSHQVVDLAGQLRLLPSLPSPSLSITGQSAHETDKGSEAESIGEAVSVSYAIGSAVSPADWSMRPAVWDEPGPRAVCHEPGRRPVAAKPVEQAVWPQQGWQEWPQDALSGARLEARPREGGPGTGLAPAPLPQPEQSGTHDQAGRKVVDAGAGVAKWQERNAVHGSDAAASDMERGGLDTLEHFLSRPLQDLAFPELAPFVRIPLPLPLTNSGELFGSQAQGSVEAFRDLARVSEAPRWESSAASNMPALQARSSFPLVTFCVNALSVVPMATGPCAA